MIIHSLVYAAISLTIIIAMIIVVIWKQFELASSSVYFMLGILVGIAGWIIGDMMQIFLSIDTGTNYTYEPWVLIFSQFATICNMVAMISTVLFARVLSARETLNSKAVAIAFTLIGAVVFMTLAGGFDPENGSRLWTYTVQPYDASLDFIVTTASLWWTIADASMVLFAGGIMMWYLYRQRRFVEDKHKKIITFMMVGTFFAFIASAIIYSFYAINPHVFSVVLHLELITAAIGAAMIGIGMIWGGKQVLYGSSRVYSVHIFDEGGLSLYAGLLGAAEYDVNEHLISGVATAISNFTSQLVGKDIVPYEI
ncbi:MAG: hypothetical protein H7647_08990, partial [Candidatus Heimdallarchaeota archaeon]|nr:hypothetical protein [Candidatus Heimdallarchaeota archaeon]MCK4254561.1 hypothetical protein [Candidatus Heimdallarchaeota archaeon]